MGGGDAGRAGRGGKRETWRCPSWPFLRHHASPAKGGMGWCCGKSWSGRGARGSLAGLSRAIPEAFPCLALPRVASLPCRAGLPPLLHRPILWLYLCVPERCRNTSITHRLHTHNEGERREPHLKRPLQSAAGCSQAVEKGKRRLHHFCSWRRRSGGHFSTASIVNGIGGLFNLHLHGLVLSTPRQNSVCRAWPRTMGLRRCRVRTRNCLGVSA